MTQDQTLFEKPANPVIVQWLSVFETATDTVYALGTSPENLYRYWLIRGKNGGWTPSTWPNIGKRLPFFPSQTRRLRALTPSPKEPCLVTTKYLTLFFQKKSLTPCPWRNSRPWNAAASWGCNLSFHRYSCLVDFAPYPCRPAQLLQFSQLGGFQRNIHTLFWNHVIHNRAPRPFSWFLIFLFSRIHYLVPNGLIWCVLYHRLTHVGSCVCTKCATISAFSAILRLSCW